MSMHKGQNELNRYKITVYQVLISRKGFLVGFISVSTINILLQDVVINLKPDS